MRSQSQEEILNHAYEYTMQEDILMLLLDAFMNFSTEGSIHDQDAVYKKSLDRSRIKKIIIDYFRSILDEAGVFLLYFQIMKVSAHI